MEFTVKKIAENLWALEQQGVRCFLLTGEDKAVLVDTGFGGDILSACRTVTDKPITVINTHSDGDHCGCDHQFSVRYMHPADFARYGKGECKAIPLQEGDIFEVGGYKLEVIWIPGHTPGSIALLDREHKLLFSGDTVQTSCIYMFGEGRDLAVFKESLVKLDAMRREGVFDTVLPAHGDVFAPADILEDHIALAEDVLSGSSAPYGPVPEWIPETVKIYRHGRAHMFYPAE